MIPYFLDPKTVAVHTPEQAMKTDLPIGNFPGKPKPSKHTKTAFLVHKYMMFAAFWICIGIAVSDLVSNPQTVARNSGAAAKIRHHAAFIQDTVKRKHGARP
jgi:hypothetical protein